MLDEETLRTILASTTMATARGIYIERQTLADMADELLSSVVVKFGLHARVYVPLENETGTVVGIRINEDGIYYQVSFSPGRWSIYAEDVLTPQVDTEH